MICIAIKGPTLIDARKQLEEALPFADLVELRLDGFTNLDIDGLRNLRLAFPIPMIFTLRSHQQGGSYSQSEERRLADIRLLAELKPEYFDLENDVPPVFINEMSTFHPEIKMILSYHNFNEIPHDHDDIFHKMQKSPAHYYKIAVTPSNCIETLKFIAWAKKSNHLIGICMGAHGQICRILGPIIGCPITYAAIDENQQTAPGQLSAKTLIEKYHHSTLRPNSAVYGLIGDPVDKSISDDTHNILISEWKFDAVYVKILVKANEVEEFLQLAKQLPFAGLSVTMPLKELILPYLDKIDPHALKIGAVNTLVFKNSKIFGYNTDGLGALNAIENATPVNGKQMVIIGAGGATKAIAYEALQRGAKVTILNRHADKAAKVAAQLGCKSKALDEMAECAKVGYDILINCTPVEMPISANDILPPAFVMDIKTKPKDSELLKQAKEKGCHIIYGHQMFVEQAVGQFHLWFKDQIDVNKCRAFLNTQAEKCLSKH